MSTDVDVVIVGGGAAGVGAARRLAQSNLSTLLLEASVRLGGRAWTHEIAGLNLDLGCGWLHSAERNSWVDIARATGVHIDQTPAAWGTQHRDLGITPADQKEARKALADWTQRLATAPPASDCAADALVPDGLWNNFIRTVVGFISGARLEQLSAADYAAYDESSTDTNWRSSVGYGALVAQSFPRNVPLQLATPVESITLGTDRVIVTTRAGTIRARAVILTISTAVLAGDSIKLPRELDHWREAAARLPLGHNEKLFLEITGEGPFENETLLLGDPRGPRSGSYYIRPLGLPVIECFLGGDATRILHEGGTAAAFAFALTQLSALLGPEIRRTLRPLIASGWSRMVNVGGAYSYALPGQTTARSSLARPLDKRIFFAGEATSPTDFSTAHGAHDSGVRAATEAIAALVR